MNLNDRERLERIDTLRARFNVSYNRANEVLEATGWDLVQASLLLEKEKGGFFEEIKVKGGDLVEKVKELVHQGNVNRIVVKEEAGREILNLPVNGILAAAILAPLLAAVGAVVALAANYTLVVEKRAE